VNVCGGGGGYVDVFDEVCAAGDGKGSLRSLVKIDAR